MTRWVVTGAAGFIGSHLTRRLLRGGHRVVGFDSLDASGDLALTAARLDRLDHPGFTLVKGDVVDAELVDDVFDDVCPDRVVHLAARVGVRDALRSPREYAATNVVGFTNVLEAARRTGVGHVLYASSSSVYGDRSPQPFAVDRQLAQPVSLYAATKRADELLAHSYAHAFGLASTGLRLFTVYGPWGRPDMAYFGFARAIAHGMPVRILGDGSAVRDFTFVDDVVEAVVRLAAQPPTGQADAAWDDVATSTAPYRVVNVGRGEPVVLDHLVDLLESELGLSADRRYEPASVGDVARTHADVADLHRLVGRVPSVSIDEGIARFVAWFRRWDALPGG